MERKWVHFLFAFFWVALVFLFVRIGKILPRLSSYQDLIIYGLSIVAALICIVMLWRMEKVRNFLLECMIELEKVAWPTGKDTFSAASIVIVVVVLVSLFLSAFDLIWEALMKVIYY